MTVEEMKGHVVLVAIEFVSFVKSVRNVVRVVFDGEFSDG
jgi:hypothetical protein